MKKVIITGATGFIGGALTRHLLEDDFHVYAVVRNRDKLFEHESMSVIDANADEYINLSELVSDSIDTFYHFAWTWNGAYGADTVNYNVQIKNIKCSIDALMSAIEMKCKKFVFIGTISEVEVIKHISTNTCKPRLTCIYATAKLATEMMMKTICAKNDIQFNCALLANVFGPGDYSERSTNFILSKFINNEAPKLVEGNAQNDWLYIKDAVRLVKAVGENGINMKTYYIGHNELRPLRDIITQAKNVINPDIELKFGELPDDFITDYSFTNVGQLYRDTGVMAEYDFDLSIKEHCEWLKDAKKY